MKRSILFVFGLVALASAAHAQVTITRTDFDLFLNAKTVTLFSADSLGGMPLTIGAAGNGASVSLANITFVPYTMGQTYVDPSTTPYASEFPTATHAMVMDFQGVQGYTYLRVTASAVFSLGSAAEYTGQPIILKNDPEETVMKFPMTLGTSWSYDGKPVTPIQGVVMQTRSTSTVDATGTLVLPQGSYPCVRVKKIEFQTQRIEIGGTVLAEDVYQTATYEFYTKAGINATLDVDTSSMGGTSVNLNSANYTVALSTTPVNDANTLPKGFAISSVYPNPVSTGGTTTLTWSTDEAAEVSISISDLAGRHVADLWQGSAAPGTHTTRISAAGLGSGVYVVRATDGRRAARALMTVIR